MKIMRENERKYNLNIACKCGLREAVIADFIKGMHSKGGTTMKVIDETIWVKCTQKTMTEEIPFLTEEMVRNSVRKLEAKGILSVDILDDDKFDRTYWYSFTTYGRELIHAGESRCYEGTS